MVNIRKRNGELVPFNKQKNVDAINGALIEVDGLLYEEDTANSIAEDVYREAIKKELTVEDIQDLVEHYLMTSERKDVAKAYIRFRYKKEVARNYTSDFIAAIKEKLTAEDVQNQNANVDEHSFGGRTGEASGVVTKRLALDFLISPKAKENHENNLIYIHDLDSYFVGSHNCLSVPFDHLLANGFNTRQTDVRPAGSVNTAFQLVAVIFQLQSLQQFGGVSATHLDWTMVPYVRKSFAKHYKDGLKYLSDMPDWEDIDYEIEFMLKNPTEYAIDDLEWNAYNYKAYGYAVEQTRKEVHQAVEGLYHNLNTLQSRSGNQLPFTSINYGTCTLPEGRMVIEELLNVSIEGLGALHKTSIFPCGIFQLGKGINREGCVIDMAIEADLVQKSGSWYSYNGEKIGQGKENVRLFLQANPEIFNLIEEQLKTKLGFENK